MGNYLGAMKQARELGSEVFIADLHGIHTPEEIETTYYALKALGIPSCKQSEFGHEHLKLYVHLQNYAAIGHLSRMTQYKEKGEKESENALLLTYPVLMTADIFFKKATHVPVGNDQMQHIEFARDLHDRVKPDCPKPEAVIGQYPRIMSLTDGRKKMSKSDEDDMSRINLTDSADIIHKKVMVAKTAMDFHNETPEMINLKTIYKAVGGKENHTRFKEFKSELADLIIAELK